MAIVVIAAGGIGCIAGGVLADDLRAGGRAAVKRSRSAGLFLARTAPTVDFIRVPGASAGLFLARTAPTVDFIRGA